MRVLTLSITADVQVHMGKCWFVGADLYHTTDTNLIVYNEAAATKTAGQIIAKLAVTDEMQNCHVDLAHPIQCNGIYVDWTAGLGTIYYSLG